MENIENINTSWFYKNDNWELLFAKNSVFNKNYELHINQKDNYEYPVDWWIWFSSEESAREFLNLVI